MTEIELNDIKRVAEEGRIQAKRQTIGFMAVFFIALTVVILTTVLYFTKSKVVQVQIQNTDKELLRLKSSEQNAVLATVNLRDSILSMHTLVDSVILHSDSVLQQMGKEVIIAEDKVAVLQEALNKYTRSPLQ